MAEVVSSTTVAQPGMNPASNEDTEKGIPMPSANGASQPIHSSDNGSLQDPIADEKATAAQENEVPPRQITGIRWIIVVIAILSSTFLFALDNTVVADVQPNIVLSLGEIQKLPWLPIAFLVAAVSTNLIWGKIYGQFNAKWLYIFCTSLFEIGSAVCASAPTMNALIGGRALAGLGGAGMYVKRGWCSSSSLICAGTSVS